jgi:hypothetical protein
MARVVDIVLLVKEVHDRLEPLSAPLLVSRIKNDLAANLKYKIDLLRVNWDGVHVLGTVRKYETDGRKHARIVVSEKLNTCWARFVGCKEMAHLLIDRPGDETTDPIRLISSFMGGVVAEKIDADISSEHWAYLAAIELLMPWRLRGTIQEMIASGKSSYDVALLFRVPERIVELWRSPWYQDLFGKAWEGM